MMANMKLQAPETDPNVPIQDVRIPRRIHEQIILLTRIAHQKPHDTEAQRRAMVARAFHSNCGSPRLTNPVMEGNQPNSLIETSRLPVEIYELIIRHLVRDPSRWYRRVVSQTLFALSMTSRFLQELVEPYLYKFPRCRYSQGIEAHYLFRFALAIEPRRADLVQALSFTWGVGAHNRRLYIDTALACPNLHTLKLFCKSAFPDNAEQRQIAKDLPKLFAACPNVKSLSLDAFNLGLDARRPDETTAKFIQQLTHLTIVECWSEPWFRAAVLPNLTPHLISRSLSSGHHWSEYLLQLYKQCPVLERLDLARYEMSEGDYDDVQDLIDACIAWGPTLKSLRLDAFQSSTGIVSRFLPHMQVLEELVLGEAFTVHVEDILAIAQHPVGLRTFVSRDDCIEPTDDFSKTASPKLNDYLDAMITAHSSTLQTIWLDGDFRLDRKVFESLKKASHLECIRLAWEGGLEQKDIDALLATCPKLTQPTLEEDPEEIGKFPILNIRDADVDIDDPAGSWATTLTPDRLKVQEYMR